MRKGPCLARAQLTMTLLRSLRIVAALCAAVLAGSAVWLHLTAAPTGTLIVLATGRAAGLASISPLAVHGRAGWETMATAKVAAVPAAPATITVADSSMAAGDYDAVRVGAAVVAFHVHVTASHLQPILIDLEGGKLDPVGLYAGNEAVSLGLNELAGHLPALPAFSLVDQSGHPVANANLAGHQVLLAAFHTTCRETCPLYTGLFLALQSKLPSGVMLVEATTDPDQDTPAALAAYAGAIGARWTFLTGTAAGLAALWTPLGVALSSGDSHSSTLVVVDEHGYVRDVYQGAPDLDGELAPALEANLDFQGYHELTTHGDGWGPTQVLDTLATISELESRSSGAGGVAPTIALKSLAGGTLSSAEANGRPLLVNFWASWCVPCRTELPLIQTTAKAHPQLRVLLIDERDSSAAARGLVRSLDVTLPVGLDSDGRIGSAYGVGALPATFFVWPDGMLEGSNLGQLDPSTLDRHVAILSEATGQ